MIECMGRDWCFSSNYRHLDHRFEEGITSHERNSFAVVVIGVQLNEGAFRRFVRLVEAGPYAAEPLVDGDDLISRLAAWTINKLRELQRGAPAAPAVSMFSSECCSIEAE